MTTSISEQSRTESVQGLFDALMQFSRSLRNRSADWGHVGADLTRGDIVTLGVVERAGSARPGQLAATLGVDPSVVSRQLATLHRLHLVARGTDPDDGRAEQIRITEQGRARLREAREAMCDALAARLSDWDPESIARAAAVVEDLSCLFHDAPADTADTITTATSKDAHA
jgi:DNA-binding MarR family transcriptional regulator